MKRPLARLLEGPLWVWGVLAAVAAGLLIPSSWGFVPSFGMNEDTRAQLGSGLATGAAVAFIVAAFEQRRREEDRRRRRDTVDAAVVTTLNRIISDLAVRYLRAVQIMEKEMREAPEVRVGPPDGEARWDSGSLQMLCIKGVWLVEEMRPVNTVDDARVFAAFLYMMDSLLQGGSRQELPTRLLSDESGNGTGVLPTSLAAMLQAAAEAARFAFTLLTGDGDPNAVRYERLQHALLGLDVSPTPEPGPEAAAMKVAHLALDHLHQGDVGSASTAASRARPPDLPAGFGSWWRDPEALCRWVDHAARHLQAGGDASDLLPTKVMAVPMTLGPVPGPLL